MSITKSTEFLYETTTRDVDHFQQEYLRKRINFSLAIVCPDTIKDKIFTRVSYILSRPQNAFMLRKIRSDRENHNVNTIIDKLIEHILQDSLKSRARLDAIDLPPATD
jgi:hypothetical protein